jgi:hypothetical protein
LERGFDGLRRVEPDLHAPKEKALAQGSSSQMPTGIRNEPSDL